MQNLPTLPQAMELVRRYSTSTINHLMSVWYVMKYFWEKLWEDSHYWQLVWLLHDIDWDYIEKNWDKHLKDDFEKMMSQIHAPQELIDDIKSHWYWLTWIEANTLVRKYICSVDELTWFITAVAKMMPNKLLSEVKVKSVIKKIKDKSFAKWVDREQVKNCETMLNIPLVDFIEDLINWLKPHAGEFWL